MPAPKGGWKSWEHVRDEFILVSVKQRIRLGKEQLRTLSLQKYTSSVNPSVGNRGQRLYMQNLRFLLAPTPSGEWVLLPHPIPSPTSDESSIQAPASTLPFEVVFKGEKQFAALLRVADQEKWRYVPFQERVARVGKALLDTPYQSFTLEIDDHIEAASVNFLGLDCWTLFEISIAFARMLDDEQDYWTPKALLYYIELDRYRHGKCTGNYFSRLHYLEDWFADNAKRGLIDDLTRQLGGVPMDNVAREMSMLWKSYRYLRCNPHYKKVMAEHERQVMALSCYYIPKNAVARAPGQILSGDVIGIVTKDGPRFGTSHVGLAYKVSNNNVHFLHASSKKAKRKVVLDVTLREYLYRSSGTAGIMVARPKPLPRELLYSRRSEHMAPIEFQTPTVIKPNPARVEQSRAHRPPNGTIPD